MDDEQLLDYEEEQEETQEQTKNDGVTNGEVKKAKVNLNIISITFNCCLIYKKFYVTFH